MTTRQSENVMYECSSLQQSEMLCLYFLTHFSLFCSLSPTLLPLLNKGTLTQVVSFEPLIPNRRVNVAVPISDNNVALEPDILRNFQLTQISDSNVPITTPNTTLVRIQDDDGKYN